MTRISSTAVGIPRTAAGSRRGSKVKDSTTILLNGKACKVSFENITAAKPASVRKHYFKPGRYFFTGALTTGAIATAVCSTPLYSPSGRPQQIAARTSGVTIHAPPVKAISQPAPVSGYHNKSQKPLPLRKAVVRHHYQVISALNPAKHHPVKSRARDAPVINVRSDNPAQTAIHVLNRPHEEKHRLIRNDKDVERTRTRNRQQQRDDKTRRELGDTADWRLLPHDNQIRNVRSLPVRQMQTTSAPFNPVDVIIIRRLDEGIKTQYTLLDITGLLTEAFKRPVESFISAAIELYQYASARLLETKTEQALKSLAIQLGKIESLASSLHPAGLIRSSLGSIFSLINDHLAGRAVDRNELESALMDLLNVRFTAGLQETAEYKRGDVGWQTEHVLLLPEMKTFSWPEKTLKSYDYGEGMILWRDENEDLYLRIKESDNTYKYVNVFFEGDFLTVKEKSNHPIYGSQQKSYFFDKDAGWVYDRKAFRSLDNLPEIASKLSGIGGLSRIQGYPGVYFQEKTRQYFLRIGQKEGQAEYIEVVVDGQGFTTPKRHFNDVNSFKKGGLSQTKFIYNEKMKQWKRSEITSPVFDHTIPKELKLKLSRELNLTPVTELPEVYGTNDGKSYLRTGNTNGRDSYVAIDILENKRVQIKLPSSYIQPEGASPLAYTFDGEKGQWKLDERIMGGGAGMSSIPENLEGEIIWGRDDATDDVIKRNRVVAEGKNSIGQNNIAHKIAIVQAIRNFEMTLDRVEPLLAAKDIRAREVISEYLGIQPNGVSDAIFAEVTKIVSELREAQKWLADEDKSVLELEYQGGIKANAVYYPLLNKIGLPELFWSKNIWEQAQILIHESVHAKVTKGEGTGTEPLPDNYYVGAPVTEKDFCNSNCNFIVKTIPLEDKIEIRRQWHRSIASSRAKHYLQFSDKQREGFIAAMQASTYDEAITTFINNSKLRREFILYNPDTVSDMVLEIAEFAEAKR
ncbi:MAG: hypothetical protein PW844_15725 [Pantoea sp.]|uniref:hypothetical protein n=1 Tax=Pantoea sp. TaxID=69393 RepID=UPI0023A220CF|nr:hypothetical protein [Pantoea sp.]MDE1187912.1 hypothetical protein [Pantoea sp.]